MSTEAEEKAQEQKLCQYERKRTLFLSGAPGFFLGWGWGGGLVLRSNSALASPGNFVCVHECKQDRFMIDTASQAVRSKVVYDLHIAHERREEHTQRGGFGGLPKPWKMLNFKA